MLAGGGLVGVRAVRAVLAGLGVLAVLAVLALVGVLAVLAVLAVLGVLAVLAVPALPTSRARSQTSRDRARRIARTPSRRRAGPRRIACAALSHSYLRRTVSA